MSPLRSLHPPQRLQRRQNLRNLPRPLRRLPPEGRRERLGIRAEDWQKLLDRGDLLGEGLGPGLLAGWGGGLGGSLLGLELDLGLALGGDAALVGSLELGAQPPDEAAALLLGSLVVEGDEALEQLGLDLLADGVAVGRAGGGGEALPEIVPAVGVEDGGVEFVVRGM